MDIFIEQIKNIEKKISEHPFIIDYISKNENDLPFYLHSISSKNPPEDLCKLIDELDTILCGEFIASNGQYSRKYFIAKKAGLKLRTGEKDSFGPLSSVFSETNYNWQIVFG